jgi:hypothetical protein
MATGRTMRRHAFNDLVSRLGGLSHAQLTALIGAARAVLRTDPAVTTIAPAPLLACPRCRANVAAWPANAASLKSRCACSSRATAAAQPSMRSRVCGVASRYLGNYCCWRWAIDGARIESPKAFPRITVAPIHM